MALTTKGDRLKQRESPALDAWTCPTAHRRTAAVPILLTRGLAFAPAALDDDTDSAPCAAVWVGPSGTRSLCAGSEAGSGLGAIERRRCAVVDDDEAGGRRDERGASDLRGAADAASAGVREADAAPAPATSGREEGATSERERTRPTPFEATLLDEDDAAPLRSAMLRLDPRSALDAAAGTGARALDLATSVALHERTMPDDDDDDDDGPGVALASSRCLRSDLSRSSLAAVESLRSPGVLGGSESELERERTGPDEVDEAVLGAGSIDGRGRASRGAGAVTIEEPLCAGRRKGVAVAVVVEDEAESTGPAFFCARSSSSRRLRRSAPVSLTDGVAARAAGALVAVGWRGGDGPTLPMPRRSPSATTTGSAAGAAPEARGETDDDEMALSKNEPSSVTVRVEQARVEVDESSVGRSTLVGWIGLCRPSSSVLVDSGLSMAVGGLWSRL